MTLTLLIIGLVLLVLEIFDGSLYFFAPTGVAVLGVAGLSALFPAMTMTVALIAFSIFAIGTFWLSFYYKKHYVDSSEDVNDY